MRDNLKKICILYAEPYMSKIQFLWEKTNKPKTTNKQKTNRKKRIKFIPNFLFLFLN